MDDGTLELFKNLTSLEYLEIVEGRSKATDRILRDVFVHALPTASRDGNRRKAYQFFPFDLRSAGEVPNGEILGGSSLFSMVSFNL